MEMTGNRTLAWLLFLAIAAVTLAHGVGNTDAGAPGAAPVAPARWVKYPGNPVLGVGPAGSWDAAVAGLPTVLARDGGYLMWYSGGTETDDILRIGLATSTDGLNWNRSPANPILDVGPAGSWDSGAVTAPAVIYHDGLYRMWYRGTNDPVNYRGAGIGYATSPDGIHWTKAAANPVLTVSAAGAWDGGLLWNASVLAETGGYKMWYSARDAVHWRIGYATSPDGIAWTKAPDPVLDLGPAGAWDQTTVYYPAVIRTDAAYRMWYTGADGSRYRIGQASSPDGIVWTRDSAQPVLTPGSPAGWDGYAVLAASVIADAEHLRMWYTGCNETGLCQLGAASLGRPSYLPLIRR